MTDMQRIKNIIADQLGISPNVLKVESSRSDLGIDSLDFLELAVLLEDEFNINLDDDEIANIDTIGELTMLISTKAEQAEAEEYEDD